LRVVAALAVLAAIAHAKPKEVKYYQPFQYGEVRRVTCGNGHGSHTDAADRHAIDYGVPVGTPVVAAAPGVVVAVENRFAGRSSDAGRVNQIAIKHADGKVTVYLHLKQDGAVVEVGQEVMRGDFIGYSGNTGRSSGPHLHFGVQRRFGGPSVAFRFADFGGSGVPNYLDRVTSFNFPVRYEREYRALERTLGEYELCARLGCHELTAEDLKASAAIRMPMPLRVLQHLLQRRDRTLAGYEQAAAGAVQAIRSARAGGDLRTAVRLATFAVKDFGASAHAAGLRDLQGQLKKAKDYRETYRALQQDWKHRRLLLAAVRAEIEGRRKRRLGPAVLRRYEEAVAAAPDWARPRLESHLVALEVGLKPSQVAYYQPFEFLDIRRVVNGNNCGGHQAAGNRYAFDYGMPVGTPVLASAAGVVIALEEDTPGCTGREADNNFVAIRHADGYVSEYHHLEHRSVLVDVGQKVGRGDLIAYSGCTGGGDPQRPCLHFGLHRGLHGPSVPMRFADFGNRGTPNHLDLVTSFNFPERHIETSQEIRDTLKIYALCSRFDCLEVVARKLKACTAIHFPWPLRSLQNRIRQRDAALAAYEEKAAARLQAIEAAQAGGDLATAVRLASFGVKDFALSQRAGAFRTALTHLKEQGGYWNAYRSLEKERAYRRLIKVAVLSEVEGNEPRSATARRYRAALRMAPESAREEVRQHAQAIEGSG
jgi:murein DD-endopeptidase MepM/ murein hydrolase activator NlpD